MASVFTESRGGGHLVAFTTVRGFLSPFFSLSFPDGGGDGWTLDAGGKAFKLLKRDREGGKGAGYRGRGARA